MPALNNLKLCLGIALLCASCLVPFLGFWVARLPWNVALKSAVIGALTVGAPELLAILAAALLGKEAFHLLTKQALTAISRLSPRASVSKSRYNFGLALFLVTFLPTYVMGYFPQILPDYARVTVNICADLLFVASLFVLGGDFWDKLRALFVYDAKAQFPEGS